MPHTYTMKWPLALPTDSDDGAYLEDECQEIKSPTEWLECCVNDALARLPNRGAEKKYKKIIRQFVDQWLWERPWLTEVLRQTLTKREICKALIKNILEARRNEQPTSREYSIKSFLVTENARVSQSCTIHDAQEETIDKIRERLEIVKSADPTDAHGEFFVVVNGMITVLALESINAALREIPEDQKAVIKVFYWEK